MQYSCTLDGQAVSSTAILIYLIVLVAASFSMGAITVSLWEFLKKY